MSPESRERSLQKAEELHREMDLAKLSHPSLALPPPRRNF
ncbi:hypothetical protein ASZ90_001254 [hydrocarbon metagenome]|uniref:Uncharacterized protein n=1 Tax=hydrocarbon metagenome TaxID=938273 RepID=A0A0W8G749_9ZZZZ